MFYSLFPLAGIQLQRIIHPELQKFYVDKINTLWKGRRSINQFPGANPVSMMRQDIVDIANSIKSIPWFVTEKTDGTRFLLMLTLSPQAEPVALLIDRSFGIYVLPKVCFLSHLYIYGVIMDTELVEEKSPIELDPELGLRPKLWVLYAFDLMISLGRNICGKPLIQRYELLKQLINETYSPQIGVDICLIRVKQFYPYSEMEHLCRNVLPTLQHANDGLIIMNGLAFYKSGMQQTILKWKEKSNQSVDFLLHLQNITNEGEEWLFGLYVNDVTGTQVLAHYLRVNVEDLSRLGLKNVYELEMNVAECFWQDSKGWILGKLRQDKKEPNYENTLRKTVENIKENITMEELIETRNEHLIPIPKNNIEVYDDDGECDELVKEVFG